MNIYIHIGNENIYKRFKVLTKSVYKLPSAFYFYICFFNFRTKVPLLPQKRPLLKYPPPPPKWPLAVWHDEGLIGHFSHA